MILVYCGALRTEPDYFDGLKRSLRARPVPTYDKSRLDFAHFAAGLADAVKRARDLEPTGTDHRRNPSTNLWQLVEGIMGPR